MAVCGQILFSSVDDPGRYPHMSGICILLGGRTYLHTVLPGALTRCKEIIWLIIQAKLSYLSHFQWLEMGGPFVTLPYELMKYLLCGGRGHCRRQAVGTDGNGCRPWLESGKGLLSGCAGWNDPQYLLLYLNHP